MKDVVARIARLRALQATLAHAERVKAEAARDAQVAVEDQWSEQMGQAHTAVALDGGDAVARGVFVLNAEMRRRGVRAEVDRLQRVVDEATAQCRVRETEQKVAERLCERRAVRRRAEAMKAEQAELDELARNGWMRGNS